MTVYKLIEVVGTSGTSIDDAIRGAIERASTSVDDLQWFEVKEIRGRIGQGNSLEFQVKVNIGFTVHAPSDVDTRKTGAREATSRQTRSAAAQLVAKKGGRRRSDLAKNFEEQRRGRS
ncbi:MAG TPA: dodecin [Candidatus Thermoplasmatota archaeon]|nr:dodecin [Candidatus Thermoplasmatota archaeon]